MTGHTGNRMAGHITSAAYGHTLGRAVAMGYVCNGDGYADAAFVSGGTYQIDAGGERFGATAHLGAPYDPSGGRARS